MSPSLSLSLSRTRTPHTCARDVVGVGVGVNLRRTFFRWVNPKYQSFIVMVLKWGTKGVVENKKISPLRGISLDRTCEM